MTDNTDKPVMKGLNFGEIIEIETFFGQDFEELSKMKITVGTAYVILKRKGEATTIQKVMSMDVDDVTAVLNSVDFEAPKATDA